MNFDSIIIVIFVCCLCFIIFQMFEFIQNYDYIIQFNKKYNNYEYVSSPSYNYIDKTIFDPNDIENNPDNKWRCVVSDSKWYGISKNGLVLENNKFAEWSLKTDCTDYIFRTLYLNYNNPCENNTNNNYCDIYKKYFN